MANFDIPATALSEGLTEDAFSDLDAMNHHVQELLHSASDARTVAPAQFVKDLKALMDEWFAPVVDGTKS